MSDHISLLTATDARSHIHLIVGSGPLAASRCNQSLGVGATPVLLAPETAEIHYNLQKRIDNGDVEWLKRNFEENDLFTLGREEVGHFVDAVFVTLGAKAPVSASISQICKRNRIPVNVVDATQLCSFSLLSTHTDGPLQIAVTTNGRGCKLASRIRREIAASLPKNLGVACQRLGDLRRKIQQEDHTLNDGLADDDGSAEQSASFNRLVMEADPSTAKNRRIRWLSQVCEYWPLSRLAAVTDGDMMAVLNSYEDKSGPNFNNNSTITSNTMPRGQIILAGSGPGHPDLLTQATYKAIQSADLILADKLVPSGVLDLIPRRTPVHIARKFPGNAEAAQEELFETAIAGVREGKIVLRLKQGDPFIYGRGGEEVAFFRRHGMGDHVLVLPGITSALSAPLFAGIPPTQRDIADQVLVCTGTGRKGKAPEPPEFVKSRTVVFLMALHRIESLVKELTEPTPDEKTDTGNGALPTNRGRAIWPATTPCAVIERASCPDQRVVRTTLDRVGEAIEQEGSRPPGLLVVGAVCETLWKPQKGKSWVVEDGFKGLGIGRSAWFKDIGCFTDDQSRYPGEPG